MAGPMAGATCAVLSAGRIHSGVALRSAAGGRKHEPSCGSVPPPPIRSATDLIPASTPLAEASSGPDADPDADPVDPDPSQAQPHVGMPRAGVERGVGTELEGAW
jgi:hypothetical protein|mmetsp:Transcript_54149/g.121411  ORF Transcript_54149/g.121411 Transcript_54149/m.121411 type:complete len:105 (-) Transcript_54149:1066-1380(-)